MQQILTIAGRLLAAAISIEAIDIPSLAGGSGIVRTDSHHLQQGATGPWSAPPLAPRGEEGSRQDVPSATSGRRTATDIPIFRFEGLVVDARRKHITRNGSTILLSSTEFRLLVALMRRQGWVLSHDELIQEVWGENCIGYRSNLKQYVSYLRRKLERNPRMPELIQTRHGQGYLFADPVTEGQ